MSEQEKENGLGAELLQKDERLNSSTYEEYRMKLEEALARAERREKLAGRVAVTSFAIAFVLMFVGGEKWLGAFDPWDRDATVVSVTLGVIYGIAAVLFWVSLASYFSRFRPRVREARENIRDANILELQREVAELRKEIEAIAPPNNQN